MFRGTQQTELSLNNFGAGSIIKESSFQSYLVVACLATTVNLLDLNTFKLVGSNVMCQDSNFLSEAEVYDLCKMIGGTRSDYDFIPSGLKGNNFG